MKFKCILTLMAFAITLSASANTSRDSVDADWEREVERFMFEMNQRKQASTNRGKAYFIGVLGYNNSTNENRRNYVKSDIRMQWDARDWVSILGGLRATTVNMYYFTFEGTFKIPFESGQTLGLKNKYLYKIYANENLNALAMCLAAEYVQDYISLTLGGMGQFNTQLIVGKDAKRFMDWRWSMVYDLRLWCMKRSSNWNLGLAFSNLWAYTIDTWENPSFLLKAWYDFRSAEGIRLLIEGGCNTRIANGTMQYSGAWGEIGVRCRI
ncbi:MAG: hypothetical protein MJZ95_05170 [Paludibacteraceae bacterium]|nr:hypothetical protein [Paludibacteraceae bacterium]